MTNKRRSEVGDRISAGAANRKRPCPKVRLLSRKVPRSGVGGSAAEECDERNPANVAKEFTSEVARTRSAPEDGGFGKEMNTADEDSDADEELLEGADEETMGEDEMAGDQPDQEGSEPKKHIHPCICDLTGKQKARIAAHLAHQRQMQRKHERRVKEIEAELARLEEERLERERELQEQQELFGDEYELVGAKKKRKKRSARRASMVSLGVKQVINWRKQPRIEVKPTKSSRLRKEYTAYCGRHAYPVSPITDVDYRKEPEVPIRATVTSTLRSKVNIQKKDYLIKHEDKRPIFQTPYYV